MTTALQLVIACGGLAVAAALGACVAQRARAGRPPRTAQDATTGVITSAAATEDLPPLDVAARHVRHQTATFALG